MRARREEALPNLDEAVELTKEASEADTGALEPDVPWFGGRVARRVSSPGGNRNAPAHRRAVRRERLRRVASLDRRTSLTRPPRERRLCSERLLSASSQTDDSFGEMTKVLGESNRTTTRRRACEAGELTEIYPTLASMKVPR